MSRKTKGPKDATTKHVDKFDCRECKSWYAGEGQESGKEITSTRKSKDQKHSIESCLPFLILLM